MRDTYLRGQATPTVDPVLAGMDDVQRYYHLRAREQLIRLTAQRRAEAADAARREWAAKGVDLDRAEVQP